MHTQEVPQGSTRGEFQVAGTVRGAPQVASVWTANHHKREGNSYNKGIARGEPVGEGVAQGEPVGEGVAQGEPVGEGVAQGEPVGEGTLRVIYFAQAKYITRVFISANTVRTNEHVMVVLAGLASR